MATTKKKTSTIIETVNESLAAIKKVKATVPDKTTKPKAKKSSTGAWPKVVKGNHLTVTTFEDGRTELAWDDAALLEEVRAAIKSAEPADTKPAVKAKTATRQKKAKV